MQSYISGQTMKWGIPFRNMHNGNMQLHVLPFLAHLSKGNLSFCHHLASVVC